MPTAAPPAPPAGTKGGKAAPAVARAFRSGVQSLDTTPYDNTTSTTTSTQDLPVLNVPPQGWLRDIYIVTIGTTAGNGANTTFAADGPFNVYDSITFEDTDSQPIVGPVTGWELAMLNKFGGYNFSDDPRAANTFSATTGAGATGGSFQFVLRIPVELVPRDALGALMNKSASATFKVRLRLAATATVYGTPPTNAPSVRTRMTPVNWWDPPERDLKGRPLAQEPPANNTTQYWTRQVYTVAAGTMLQKLDRVGFQIRNLIFILRDGSQSRTQGETDWPDPFQLFVDAIRMVDRGSILWRRMIAQWYDYTVATADAFGAKDPGVYVQPFCVDFSGRPGYETCQGYLGTSSATYLAAQGTIGGSGAHTLTVLTNDVSPFMGDDMALTNGK